MHDDVWTVWRHQLFSTAFRSLPVYNILFEDSAVDEEILGLDDQSRVLSITGAGCGVAGMMARRPALLDAVDINRHHLALAGLKIEASRAMRRHAQFYDLLGRGWVPNARVALTDTLRHMPRWMAAYWQRRMSAFETGFYRAGMTSRMLATFRLLTGLDERWLRASSPLSAEEREREIETAIAPVLRSRPVRAFFDSPAQLLALGINHSQRDRLLRTEQVPDLAEFVIAHLKRLARTDIATNWFAWYGVTGHFDHERPDAVPPYLRADHHAAAQRAPTRVRYHHKNVFDVLASAPTQQYTHYTLCDAPDWLTPRDQQRLLREIVRTSRPGARVLVRSVEDSSIAERAALGRTLRRMDAASDFATTNDRSRQYRRVDLFEVVA